MSGLTAVSLFAGIGTLDLALKRAGVDVVAAVEIDKDCQGVLRRHFPDVALFGDVTEVTGGQLIAAGFVPGRGILGGGFPCQDLSIAGRRAGLGGARSGLFWQIVRLARELSPRWLVLENVPGLLSAVCPCPGDDTCVVNGRAVRCGEWRGDREHREWSPNVPHSAAGGACAGGCMAVHGGAMGTVVGALAELGYGVCWRVLDAAGFGVPQRRERVFIAGRLGDGATPVQVLLEPESGEGHPAAGRPARAHTPGSIANGTGSPSTVGTLATTGPGGGWRLGADEAAAGQLVVASTLQGGGRRGHRVDAEGAAGGHLVAVPVALRGRADGCALELGKDGDPAFALRNGGSTGGGSSHAMVAYALTSRADRADRADREETWIVQPEPADAPLVPFGCERMGDHALTAEGHDASEDGTGRGSPLVPMVAVALTAGSAASDGVNPPGRRREDDHNLVAVPIQDGRSMAKHQNGLGVGTSSDPAYTLDSTGAQAVAMAFNPQTGGDMRLGYGSLPTALSCTQATGVQQAMAVRRLTPLERERLQGLPDNWTKWLANGAEQSDAARERQTGNAMALPVVEWLTRRLVAADETATTSNTEAVA